MSETSDVVTPILKRLELLGYRPERMQSGALRGGRVRLAPEGTPDLHVAVEGQCVYLECKRRDGKVTKEQERRHAELRRNGAIVEVVRSVEEAEIVIRQVQKQNGLRTIAVAAAQTTNRTGEEREVSR